MLSIKHKKAILDLFKMAVAEEKNVKCEGAERSLLKCGYVCDKNVDTKAVLEWAEENHFNANATFYQTFLDVVSKTRFELFMDQIVHYFTTYTLDSETPFIVNDTPIDLQKMDVKFIKAISFEEVTKRCQNMLYSGVALKQETIEKILFIIGTQNIDIDKVKNREAQAIISVNMGVYPTNGESALRCFIYQATGKTLLIKDKNTIETLKNSNIIIPDILLERFSEIFFRYKPLFLALKKHNQYKVNTLRRMTRHTHTPFKAPFWSEIMTRLNTNPDFYNEIIHKATERIGDLTVYKMISLYNLCNMQLNSNLPHVMYIIRNGKLFVKDITDTPKSNYACEAEERKIAITSLKKLLFENIVKRVKANVGRDVVELPLSINLTCPTSEKSFMGEIPMYSWVDMDFDDAIIGIYWHEKDGARDLDLSYIDKSGMKIGWNAGYYSSDKTFVYSGDMTTAPEGASELLYRSRNASSFGSVRVNPYCFVNENYSSSWGREPKGKAKYKVFFAKENIKLEMEVTKRRNPMRDSNFRNYMVDPDNIIYQYEDIIEGEKILGTFIDNRFVFGNAQTATRRVSKIDNINGAMLDIFADYQKYCLKLDDVLKHAQVNLTYTKEKVLSKDDILKLFQ